MERRRQVALDRDQDQAAPDAGQSIMGPAQTSREKRRVEIGPRNAEPAG